MLALPQDLRYALRTFARNPGFTLAALLSLAIGIGANTSIFSVAHALFLRPLPFPDAERLVILWNRSPGLNILQDWFSTAQYFDIKSQHQGFDSVALAIGGIYNLTGDGEPERVGAVRVSSNLFSMLGARPLHGRLFVTDEDSPGHTPTAVLSYALWARRYGSDPAIVGRSILINGQPYLVAGILPGAFTLPHEVLPVLRGTDSAEILLNLPLAPAAARVRDHEDYNILGKLKRGVPVGQAQAEMDTITAHLRRDFPEVYPPNGGLTFSIVPLLEEVVGDVRPMLYVLLGSVGFVLLIACANVANLMLSRGIARQQEMGVRAAMGATRGRIVRQLLTESVLLALGGGVVGVLFSIWSVRWIHAVGTKTIPRLQEIAIDGRVLLFTLLLSLFSGMLFGLAPALRISRLDLYTTLRAGGRGVAGIGSMWRRGHAPRRLLVICELALSLVLLIGAGLLIRSFARLEGVLPGFNPSGVLTFDLTMAGRKYTDSQVVLNSYRRLWDSLEHLPGVVGVGGITSMPLSKDYAWTPITIEGRTPPAGEKFLNADARVAGGHYFQAMGIPLLAGRFFNDQDTVTNPRVVIVDERMALEYWPGGGAANAVGKRIHVVQSTSKDYWQTVVGVVGRVKQESLDSDPRIAFYSPQTQAPSRALTVVLRSVADPAALSGAVKREIRDLDPDLPMYSVRTMRQRVDESLARRRFFKMLLALFAGLALALASIGIYGVMAYLVSQGTREIGIRIALGATQRGILGMVVRQGMTLAISGVAIGLAGAFVLTRLMRGLLFGIEATDTVTFTAIPLLLTVVALLATYIPARRAASIDAIVSLRCE
ncbi:MAG TPA: ABC transporter permease [Bryobacteraceae bacterium]|nr:ABC transporter permease [Bryobacteraceae bacterium]